MAIVSGKPYNWDIHTHKWLFNTPRHDHDQIKGSAAPFAAKNFNIGGEGTMSVEG